MPERLDMIFDDGGTLGETRPRLNFLKAGVMSSALVISTI